MEIALGTPEWCFKIMYVKWKLVSVCFEIVLVLAEDRCTVCAECTSGMEIILDTPDRTPTSVRLEIVLISAQHRYTVCAECTMGMEIILGTADGTPSYRESCGSSFLSIWT